MKKRMCLFLLFLVGTVSLLSLSMPFFSEPITQVYAQESEPELIYYRGDCYEEWEWYLDGKLLNGTWNSAPQAVWNGTHWVDYIFQGLYASEGKYIVQMGLIGAEIYDYYAKFYDPNMTEVRLYDERWAVEKWKTTGPGGWDDLGAQSGTPTYTIIEYEDGINITKSFHSWAGWLNITYVFHEDLKHEVTFLSEIGSDETFRVLQQWSGIVGTKCKHKDGETEVTGSHDIDSYWFQFGNETNDYTVFENQWSMAYYDNGTVREKECLERPVTVEYKTGNQMKCNFIFGNWSLASGETLTIDPTTSTLSSPTVDGFIKKFSYGASPEYEKGGGTTVALGYYGTPTVWFVYRGYIEWDISSLNLPSLDVTDVKFLYHGWQNSVDGHIHKIDTYKWSTTNEPIFIFGDAGDGTVYVAPDGFPVVGTNKQVDLGSSAETDIENKVSDGWFAIGLQADTELEGKADPENEVTSGVYDQSYDSANPKPTLEVTYSYLRIGEFQAPSRPDVNEYFFLNCSINDPDGVSDFVNATIELNSTIILKWVNNTNTFTEYSDSNNYCTLDASNSLRTTVNSTAYKLSWKIKLNTVSSWSVTSTNTKVYDQSGASGSNSQADLFITDRLQVQSYSVSDSRVNVNDNVDINATIWFDYDNTVCTTATITINGYSATHQGSGVYKITRTSASVTSVTYNTVACSSESTYGVTTVDQNSQSTTVVWDRIVAYWEQVNDTRLDINSNAEWRIKAVLDYDDHALGSGDSISSSWGSLTWDATNSWFDIAHTESTANAYTISLSSGSEATYGITAFSENITETSVIFDGLEVYDLQQQFLGDGEYKYQCAIRYGYDGASIDGAAVKLLRPDLVTETMFTSNSSGWISFVLSQTNATQTGTWAVYGYNDNNYGITYKAQNQTFNIRSLILNSKDDEGNSLSDTTVKVYNSSTLIHSPNSEATAYYPETTYTFKVYWLQDLLVNETSSYSLTSNSELNLTCTCYPYTLDSTTYHVASNATINTASWNSATLKMTVTFSASVDTYILVSSATTEPTYVLNCTYDIDTDFSSYLTLTHHGNCTITVAYPNWASTRIHRTDDRITSTYWGEAEQLYIILTGTLGETGTLEIYCGSRGVPQTSSGLTETVYFSATTIFVGTYTFSSTVTAMIDWTTETGGDGGRTTPTIFLTAKTIDIGSVQQGTSKTVNATATWTGSTNIILADVTFTGEGSEWLKSQLDVPQTIYRLAIETQGIIEVPITITIPSQGKLGSYNVLIEYKIQVGSSIYRTTATLLFNVVVATIPTGGIPNLVSILLLTCLISIPLIWIKKR